MRYEELLNSVTEIIKETGFTSIDEFPKLYTATTAEDKSLEAVLMMCLEKPGDDIYAQLAAELASYIELDDINMGLMAKAAQALMDIR